MRTVRAPVRAALGNAALPIIALSAVVALIMGSAWQCQAEHSAALPIIALSAVIVLIMRSILAPQFAAMSFQLGAINSPGF